MNTSYELNAYRSHELSIQMRTSSGDKISMDFQNTQELSLAAKQNGTSSEASFSFASLQQYQFQMQSNGIDAQDQKEIDAFMKIAQPYIDNFMQELSENQQKTPLNHVSKQITREMESLKAMPEPSQNHAKNDIVKLFDHSLKQVPQSQNIFEESQKLLDAILKAFEPTAQKLLYA
jgi:hypothetical protein